MVSKGNLRTCSKGHNYYKSSDCPTCPKCENERIPAEAFLSLLPASTRRALEGAGILRIDDLAQYTEKQLLALHGFGPASLPALRTLLSENGLKFKEK